MYTKILIVTLVHAALSRHVLDERAFRTPEEDYRSGHHEPYVENNNNHAIQNHEKPVEIIHDHNDGGRDIESVNSRDKTNYENTSANNFGYYNPDIEEHGQRSTDTVRSNVEPNYNFDNSTDLSRSVKANPNIHAVSEITDPTNNPNVDDMENVRGTNSTFKPTTSSFNKGEPSWPMAVFIGDDCPIGQAKVSGTCIDIHKK